MGGHTNGQTYQWADIQIGRHTNRRTYQWADIPMGLQTDGLTDKWVDRLTATLISAGINMIFPTRDYEDLRVIWQKRNHNNAVEYKNIYHKN